MKRRRVRTAARWAGTVACVLLAGVWVGSWWWGVEWEGSGPHSGVSVRVASGFVDAVRSEYRIGFPLSNDSLPVPLLELLPRDQWYQRYWLPYWYSCPKGTRLSIPLYLPLALTLLPTAWLWRGEVRRRRLMKAGGCGLRV